MKSHAGITRCIECGGLVLHPGGRKAPRLDVDTLEVHACQTVKRRPPKAASPPQEAVERAWHKAMGHIGRELPT